ncbi:trypsin-like serine peptidase [Nonomuraea typhae]|uniref:trypsin-like serine peptidase n=1 Tax=Nonomuraea typhae TaxID=2603600 RepID=UPI0012FCC2AB|nr:trypsin-like peptidase domain-containing protein [Nonomuraea typhae]
MLRLLLIIALTHPPAAEPPERSVPGQRVLTPGGDRLGFAPARRARPDTGVLVGYDRVAGQDVMCGAAVVRSRSKSLVVTAAHCVRHRGRALEQMAFVPGYEGGRAPLGVWRAVRSWVPSRWRDRPDTPARLPFDLALVGVARKGRDPLESVTGRGLRPVTRGALSRPRALDLLGYPGGRRYPGTRLYHCLGQAAPYRGVLVTHNCHASGGGSGGPALYGEAVAGVVSSSSPMSDRDGFTVLAPLGTRSFRRMMAHADRVMRRG